MTWGLKIVYISMLSAKWREDNKWSKHKTIENAKRLIFGTIRKRNKLDAG